MSSEKQSTHSYDYKSSIKTGSSARDAGSIIENLHALNINIQKREKELEMRGNPSREELERKRLMLIHADSNSVNSQIPCESDSGGPAVINGYEEGVQNQVVTSSVAAEGAVLSSDGSSAADVAG